MRIALLSPGRFNLVDIGRELNAFGHDVKIYSLLPPMETRRFGLPDQCNRWLGVGSYPYYAGVRFLADGRIKEFMNARLQETLDESACVKLEPCDVLIAMSGTGVRVLDEARRRYGARIFVERSSVHILTQRDILQRMPGAPPDYAAKFRYERELLSYALADVVTVPSHQAHQSFIEQGHSPEHLFINAFGVALEQFRPTPAPSRDPHPTIVMAGAWSMRKGCDVLLQAWRKLPGTKLLHVGPVVDAPLPDDAFFEHVDSVPQSELPKYYAQGHVAVLASREEGLANVQVQAVACGVPLVCTSRTGGEDLKKWVNSPDAIRVVAPEDADALANALQQALDTAAPAGQMRDLLGENRQQLSWPAAGRRYEQRLLRAIHEPSRIH